jgi:hypothetical protein
MAGLEGRSRELQQGKGAAPKQRTTRLFFDEQGLCRVVSHLEGCFPDLNLTRRPEETEPLFRRRIAAQRPGILNG